MLVLTRKLGEQIVIGEGITVSVIAIQGNRIRLGIDAPAGVSIRRSELPFKDTSAEPVLAGITDKLR